MSLFSHNLVMVQLYIYIYNGADTPKSTYCDIKAVFILK